MDTAAERPSVYSWARDKLWSMPRALRITTCAAAAWLIVWMLYEGVMLIVRL